MRYAISRVPFGATALIVFRPAFSVGRSAAGTRFTYSLTGTSALVATAAHDSAVFDFLKRRGEPKPQPWHPGRIAFTGEQRGPAEDQFTRALASRFASDARIERAYLVRAEYPKTGPQRGPAENRGPDATSAAVEVLLCLVAPEDHAIVAVVGEEFRKIFASSQHMDTLFLTGEQEREVAKVARPFFSAAR